MLILLIEARFRFLNDALRLSPFMCRSHCGVDEDALFARQLIYPSALGKSLLEYWTLKLK